MDVFQGTLDMLVLRTLANQPLHGYGIAKALESASSGRLTIEFGSLYPALKRLELKGWLESTWETSELNRRAKYYRLTSEGQKQVRKQFARWSDFVAAVGAIMNPKGIGNA